MYLHAREDLGQLPSSLPSRTLTESKQPLRGWVNFERVDLNAEEYIQGPSYHRDLESGREAEHAVKYVFVNTRSATRLTKYRDSGKPQTFAGCLN